MKCRVCGEKKDNLIGGICKECLPDVLDWETYQRLTSGTAIYNRMTKYEYLALGLSSEAGEVASLFKKWLRGDYKKELPREKIKKELGDVLWYVARLADELGFSLKEIATENLIKLYDRKNRGVIKGEGDDR